MPFAKVVKHPSFHSQFLDHFKCMRSTLQFCILHSAPLHTCTQTIKNEQNSAIWNTPLVSFYVKDLVLHVKFSVTEQFNIKCPLKGAGVTPCWQ